MSLYVLSKNLSSNPSKVSFLVLELDSQEEAMEIARDHAYDNPGDVFHLLTVDQHLGGYRYTRPHSGGLEIDVPV